MEEDKTQDPIQDPIQDSDLDEKKRDIDEDIDTDLDEKKENTNRPVVTNLDRDIDESHSDLDETKVILDETKVVLDPDLDENDKALDSDLDEKARAIDVDIDESPIAQEGVIDEKQDSSEKPLDDNDSSDQEGIIDEAIDLDIDKFLTLEDAQVVYQISDRNLRKNIKKDILKKIGLFNRFSIQKATPKEITEKTDLLIKEYLPDTDNKVFKWLISKSYLESKKWKKRIEDKREVIEEKKEEVIKEKVIVEKPKEEKQEEHKSIVGRIKIALKIQSLRDEANSREKQARIETRLKMTEEALKKEIEKNERLNNKTLQLASTAGIERGQKELIQKNYKDLEMEFRLLKSGQYQEANVKEFSEKETEEESRVVEENERGDSNQKE